MATNKNAFVRYKILDSCFRNFGKRYFIENLMEECNKALIDPSSNGISRRQIFDDILFMQSSQGWSIPLLKYREGKKVYYRYEDSTFSINNIPLNHLEIDQLKLAFNIVSQFKGMPQFDWVYELTSKLQQGVLLKDISPIMEFESNQYLQGIEHLGLLYNSIYHQRVLSIEYKSFTDISSKNIIIHPYYLKQFNNRWFLFGLNPENGKSDWNMALDRIINIKEIEDKYIINEEIDWSEYFEDIIGVTKNTNCEIEEIKLHFFGITGNYVVSKPLHGSQKAKWINNELLEVKLKLITNFELESLILSYGERVKVISPSHLVTAIYLRLKLANVAYSP
ncbi:helix-turn-helix transcriptional regulator [Flavobacterium aquidurense]|uniref:helix-turn-helix transcriptional regulator n=1 Tax=Flavobacterium aquidurense TaxID=362413 RepID=UPI003711A47E